MHVCAESSYHCTPRVSLGWSLFWKYWFFWIWEIKPPGQCVVSSHRLYIWNTIFFFFFFLVECSSVNCILAHSFALLVACTCIWCSSHQKKAQESKLWDTVYQQLTYYICTLGHKTLVCLQQNAALQLSAWYIITPQVWWAGMGKLLRGTSTKAEAPSC